MEKVAKTSPDSMSLSSTQKISILKQKISHDFYQEHIKTQLNDILHPSDQLNYLVSMLELSDQDREYRSKLVNIIQTIAIQEFGSVAKVFLFGSTSRAGSYAIDFRTESILAKNKKKTEISNSLSVFLCSAITLWGPESQLHMILPLVVLE